MQTLTRKIVLVGMASGVDWPERLELLLHFGSDVNAVDENGLTALDWARCEKVGGRTQDILLAAGAVGTNAGNWIVMRIL